MKDKLLERINQARLVDDNRNFSMKATDDVSLALISVIELHSPEGKPDQQCRNCKRFYPCHTIQAIAKVLQ